MASTPFNVHEQKTNLTVTSGGSLYNIVSSKAYRHGNHIHAEVAGIYTGADTTGATNIAFFTLNGIKAPSSNEIVGTVVISDTNSNPIYVGTAYATLHPNGYFFENFTSSLRQNYRVSFIVDYIES